MLCIMSLVFFFSLMGDLPNTYSFTKAVTEYMVSTYHPEIPVAVARPSISEFRFMYYLLYVLSFIELYSVVSKKIIVFIV